VPEGDFVRDAMSKLANHVGEWCGFPIPIDGERLILEPRHPASKVYEQLGKREEQNHDNQQVINVWYSHARRCDVVMYRENNKFEWGIIPALHHIKQDLSTLGCADAWTLDAECKALETLRHLVPKHIFKYYFLTGMLPETSKRSGVTYLFRRLKPTVAIRPHKNGKNMKILATLCLHPIGYYADTWAGAMCPTDDVMAHLLLMRGDEKLFWRRANQISPHRPEAGL